MNNIGGGWPGAVSLAGLGQPARYTLCLAERAAASPWPPLHVELGFRPEQSTVTVLRAETAINVTGGLAELASAMGSAASLFAILHDGRVAVIVAPHVAAALARDGWSKDDVRRRLHAEGRLSTPVWRASWLHATVQPGAWPAWVRDAEATGAIPAVRAPEDITRDRRRRLPGYPPVRLLPLLGSSPLPHLEGDRASRRLGRPPRRAGRVGHRSPRNGRAR